MISFSAKLKDFPVGHSLIPMHLEGSQGLAEALLEIIKPSLPPETSVVEIKLDVTAHVLRKLPNIDVLVINRDDITGVKEAEPTADVA